MTDIYYVIHQSYDYEGTSGDKRYCLYTISGANFSCFVSNKSNKFKLSDFINKKYLEKDISVSVKIQHDYLSIDTSDPNMSANDIVKAEGEDPEKDNYYFVLINDEEELDMDDLLSDTVNKRGIDYYVDVDDDEYEGEDVFEDPDNYGYIKYLASFITDSYAKKCFLQKYMYPRKFHTKYYDRNDLNRKMASLMNIGYAEEYEKKREQEYREKEEEERKEREKEEEERKEREKYKIEFCNYLLSKGLTIDDIKKQDLDSLKKLFE